MEQVPIDGNSANTSELYDLMSIRRSDINYHDPPFELSEDYLNDQMSDLQPLTNDHTVDEYFDENGLWNPLRFGDMDERANEMEDR